MIFDEAIRSGNLSQSDLAIVNYIAQHPHDVVHMTARQLAEAAYVSPSTVVRLCKKAGFSSFGDMKVLLAREMADEDSFEHLDADFPELADASAAQVIARVSSMEREAVRKTERLLAQVNWTPILDALDKAEGISIRAIAYSSDAAMPFAHDVQRMGRRVTICREQSESRQWLASCPRNEFVVFISYSGVTPDLVDESCIVKARGLDSLSICVSGAPLAAHTTWTLPLANTERPGANDRISHFQSIGAELYALNTLYALWFARNYYVNVRSLAANLERQGLRVNRSGGQPHLEDTGRFSAYLVTKS